jgi:hypothetical protein
MFGMMAVVYSSPIIGRNKIQKSERILDAVGFRTYKKHLKRGKIKIEKC